MTIRNHEKAEAARELKKTAKQLGVQQRVWKPVEADCGEDKIRACAKAFARVQASGNPATVAHLRAAAKAALTSFLAARRIPSPRQAAQPDEVHEEANSGQLKVWFQAQLFAVAQTVNPGAVAPLPRVAVCTFEAASQCLFAQVQLGGLGTLFPLPV